MSEVNVSAMRRELPIRKRRELGLTLMNLASVTKQLKAEGSIDGTTPRAEIAAMILSRMQESNQQQFAGLEAFDIQSILDLIEALLPLILQLLDLFS